MPLGLLPSDYKIISINIPDSINILILPKNKLPDDWNTIPHSRSTQNIGDNFIRQNKSAVIKVPSAVVPGDFNYLINTDHDDLKEITIVNIESFMFDSRLFIQ